MKRWWHRSWLAGVAAVLAVAALADSGGGVGRPASSVPPNLATITEWNRLGRTAEAERAARSLLATVEVEHGRESLAAAEVLDQLAISLRRSGKARDPEALDVCERALAIKRAVLGREDPRLAASLQSLGMLYSARQDFRKALPLLQEALGIRERAFGGVHPEVALTLIAIASAQSGLGRHGEALAATQRAVAIQRATLPEDDPDRAMALSSLATLLYYVGEFGEAAATGEEAIAMLERGGTTETGVLGTCYHNLAGSYSEMGDHELARKSYERALQIRKKALGADHEYVADTMVELGNTYRHLGENAKARDLFLKAMDTYARAGLGDGPSAAWARQKIGWFYLETGSVAKADAALQDALRLQTASLGPDHWQLWMTLRGLARVSTLRRDYPEARQLYERCVALVERSFGDEHPDLGVTLKEYARSLLDAGDSTGAFRTALRAAEINTEHLRRTAQRLSERQSLVYTSARETGLSTALAVLAGGGRWAEAGATRDAWAALIRQRTMVLDEFATRSRVASGDSLLTASLHDLDRARTRFAGLAVRGPLDDSMDRYRNSLERAGAEVDRIEREIAQRSDAFRSERERMRIGFDAVNGAIPTSTTLIAFAKYGEGADQAYVAFRMSPGRHPEAIPLGRAASIDSLVAAWIRVAGRMPAGTGRSARDGEAASRRAGETLRAHVWDPIRSLKDSTQIVFLVPEGAFHFINVAALPESDGRYLVETGPAVHLLSSERDLVEAGRKATLGHGLLACGGPQFDLERRTGLQATAPGGPALSDASGRARGSVPDCADFRSVRFEPLPQAALEAREIAAAWTGPDSCTLLIGPAATERAVKEKAPGRRVVHLATHGFFLDEMCTEIGAKRTRSIGGIARERKKPDGDRRVEQPLRLSGLALAGANQRAEAGRDDEDGILTAEEISSLDLSGVRWAVLSACDTGLGDVQTGEGVLGLRRSFQTAGARTVVMSLWGVEDESAREWMHRFYYGSLHQGLTTVESVRQAELGVLRDRRARGQSTLPFYWAAFVATGDWN